MSKKQKKMLLRIIFAAVMTVTVQLLPLQGICRMAAFAVPYLTVGWDVLYSAARNIFGGQLFDEQFLMSIATLGAILLGEYTEAAGVMIFYQIGELFQNIAVGKSRRSIAALMDIRPDSAVVIRNGSEITVSPEEVTAGEIITVRPGEKIPLDGEITEGSTAVNTSALTGEGIPVDKTVGDSVNGGTLNLTGVIKIKTSGVYSESTVAKILELVENASEKKSKAEGFITKFARIYTPCVVVSALLLAFIPPLLFSEAPGEWIKRALIFLMVSCPCALVVSIPLSFFGGMGGASRSGILIKGADSLEALAKTDTVVFDKTGTITHGSFTVTAIHSEIISENALLDIAATAESYSNHPIAKAITEAYCEKIDKKRIGEVKEVAGFGISALIDGKKYFIGNAAFIKKIGLEPHECHISGTAIHIAEESEYLGHIIINDTVKPDSAAAISELKKVGIKKVVMLTGDSSHNAEEIGKLTGIDEIHCGLLPAQKVEKLEELISAGSKTAFVGDGINDAPVLARADIGIAMGTLGSDAAIEAADAVIMNDSLLKLPSAIRISGRTVHIVKQNIIFALTVKAVILILGAAGLANMWLAMLADVGVMVLAVLNSMRTMKKL